MNTMRRAPGRRWHLREATASEHEDLDRMIGTFSDRASYAAYVAALALFRLPLEQAMSQTSLGTYRPTRLADALLADMADLGLDAPAGADVATPANSELLGTLYVLEGAALGGQILRKRAAAIGFDETHGARHLAGGAENWPAFLAELDRASDYDAAAAAEAARQTFIRARDAFKTHLAESILA